MAIKSPVAGEAIVANSHLAYPLAMANEPEEPEIIYIPLQGPAGPSRRPPTRWGISIGWVLAGMAWASVFQEPLWLGGGLGLAFGGSRGLLIQRQQGGLGCLVSSVWAWPIALLGGVVWAARAI